LHHLGHSLTGIDATASELRTTRLMAATVQAPTLDGIDTSDWIETSSGCSFELIEHLAGGEQGVGGGGEAGIGNHLGDDFDDFLF